MGMAKKTNWTPEQLEAITQENCNLLVAAAAGAGKTAVLVERIIRKITDPKNPVDIDRLLIVTFTNAAAAEMRDRIAQAISRLLEQKTHSRNLQRQLTLLNKASITTLHSFFLEVIRNNFHLIDIDPGFRIADETEALLLQLEVLGELFEEQYEQEGANQDFLDLLECYGDNRDDRILQNMVLDLYSFIQSIPWPQQWLEQMTERLNISPGVDFAKTAWGKVLLDSVAVELEGLQELLKKAISLVDGEPGLEKYLDTLGEDLAGLKSLTKIVAQSDTEWDGVCSAFRDFSFKRLPRAGKDSDAAKKDQAKKLRDDVKARVNNLKEKMFSSDSAQIVADLQIVYPMMKALARLINDFSARYAAKKKQKSIVDFNDLEHFCLDILSERDEQGNIKPSETALAYRERYTEILVDEYQDSNLVQEIMLKMISREDTGNPNVFMVGDVKQSIYRFRQARPELFLEKYQNYLLEKNAPYRKILLFKNFRSRKEIVAAVNFIFKQIMSLYVGELDYTDLEALNAGADYPENEGHCAYGWNTELHLIQTGDQDVGQYDDNGAGSEQEAEPLMAEAEAEGAEGLAAEEDMPDNIQCEARITAQRIQELMRPDEQGRRFCIFDKELKQYRHLEYRDIVILLRTTRNWSDVFMEELRMYGVPAFADTGSGFFKTTEVQVVLSLLQVIDNPLQDIPLLAVLRSPIVSFTTDELAELRLVDRHVDIYHALCKLAASGNSGAAEDSGLAGGSGKASQKAAAFLERLHRWREMSLYLSTDRLLWQLYEETGYYAMVGAMPAGEQRQANLRILFERARQFEGTSYKGLFNFIYFIDKLKSSQGDMGSARILGENDNVVRIMSIHKSKGLEFPVVFLCGCGKKFNLQDSYKRILLHQELGFGPDVVDFRRRISYPSVAKQAIREKIVRESLSEEMRILYVAMTRAREKLIITGAVSDIKKAVGKWSRSANTEGEKLPVYDVHKGRSFLDWIGPALLRHEGCKALREACGISDHDFMPLSDPSLWDIRFWDKSQVMGKSVFDEAAPGIDCWLEEAGSCTDSDTDGDTDTDIYADNVLYQEIDRRLGWEYPFAQATQVPAKISVTELKRRFEEQTREGTFELDDAGSAGMQGLVKKPMFLTKQRGLSPAEAGTAMHFVMQHLDFANSNYAEQIEAMIERELLTQQQADSINLDQIRQFFESPLGLRLISSDNVHREVPFQIELPCHELYPDLLDENCKGETLLLQGVIDCYFEEGDGIVLLDYKTDYVPEEGTELIRDRYRVQINYYARALELLTRKQVKEKYIYLFSIGETLEF